MNVKEQKSKNNPSIDAELVLGNFSKYYSISIAIYFPVNLVNYTSIGLTKYIKERGISIDTVLMHCVVRLEDYYIY